MKKWWYAIALIASTLAIAAADSLPSISGPIAANGTLTLPGLGTYSTCSIDVTGTWTGTLDVVGPGNAPILVRSYASDASTSASITSNGLAFVACAGLSSLSVDGGAANTGTAQVTIAASQGIAKLGTVGVASIAASAPITSSGGATPTVGCATCVTAVTASGNLTSSGGTTPAISLSATPSFTSVTSQNIINDGPGGTLSFTGSTGNTFGGTDFYFGSSGITAGTIHFRTNGYSNGDTATINSIGAYTTGSAVYGPASQNLPGPIKQPGYAQHGIVSVTTPASCTAFLACASGSVTFSTAMTAATYECSATAETYPYTVIVSAKTMAAITFELYPLVAVASAQTVPVDYACAA